MPYIIMEPQKQFRKAVRVLQLDATAISYCIPSTYLQHIFLYIDLAMELSGFILISMLLQHMSIRILEAYSLNFKLYIFLKGANSTI